MHIVVNGLDLVLESSFFLEKGIESSLDCTDRVPEDSAGEQDREYCNNLLQLVVGGDISIPNCRHSNNRVVESSNIFLAPVIIITDSAIRQPGNRVVLLNIGDHNPDTCLRKLNSGEGNFYCLFFDPDLDKEIYV